MIELGLVRIRKLLAHTPLPWRAVHVAGTNGKGSVCAYVSAMLNYYNHSELLRRTGQRPLIHARFTSPHLIDRWDCITIDDKVVDKSLFEGVEAQVKARDESEGIGASEFELLTATAFEIFTESRVDVGVVEVGMGGRLDATNVFGEAPLEHDDDHGPQDSSGADLQRSLPLVTAITSIGLDHQKFLGDTMAEIAREKAGILKSKVPVVVARQESADAERAITERAAAVGTGPLTFVSNETGCAQIWKELGKPASAAGDVPIEDIPIQARCANGAIAVRAVWSVLDQLGRLAGMDDDDDDDDDLLLTTLRGLCDIPRRTLWPGRLQIVELSPVIGRRREAVLDGAHNAQSAAMLRKHLDGRGDGGRSTVWLLAASQGKDLRGMLRILLRPDDVVFAVEFGPVDGMSWVSAQASADIVEDADTVCGGPHKAFGRDVELALQTAADVAEKEKREMVIAGSLYLVGDVLRLLRQSKGVRHEVRR